MKFLKLPMISISIQAAAAKFSCPVCLLDDFYSEEVLAQHVNQHFSMECVPQGIYN